MMIFVRNWHFAMFKLTLLQHFQCVEGNTLRQANTHDGFNIIVIFTNLFLKIILVIVNRRLFLLLQIPVVSAKSQVNH